MTKRIRMNYDNYILIGLEINTRYEINITFKTSLLSFQNESDLRCSDSDPNFHFWWEFNILKSNYPDTSFESWRVSRNRGYSALVITNRRALRAMTLQNIRVVEKPNRKSRTPQLHHYNHSCTYSKSHSHE